MKRVLMVQPSMNPPGGGNGVAAWIVEALKTSYRVSVLTWEVPQLEAINRFYGTSLRASEFELITLPHLLAAIARRTPTPMALAKDNFLLARARRIAAQYDLVVSANNEVDVGAPGIQYIHYPKLAPRPEVDLRWFHLAFVVEGYRWLCFRLSGFSLERMRRNLSVVNSDFIGARMRALYGVEPITLYPPIAGDFPTVAWERREDSFVCLGRISPEKRIEQIIDVLASVRGAGQPVGLHVIGTFGCDGYSNFIKGCIDANRSWVTRHENLPREELTQLLASQRYGIHAMEDEHFGMAVAEMVRAGCIVFAPDNGGPAQILGADERLLFSSPQDAARKIRLVVESHERQKQLRDHLARRSPLFSAQHFVDQFRALVARFEPG